MISRRTGTTFCRIFAFVALIAIAVLSWIALSFAFVEKAYAETQSEHDKVFGANADHGGATELSSAVSGLSNGSYYLTDDITLSQSIELYGEVALCLHGHSISASSKHIFRLFGRSCTLSIYDCGGADNCGAISGGYGFYIFNGATLNLYGGAIKDGEGRSTGVSVSGNGVFNMYDGIISGNRASGNGAGVHIGSNGNFNMYGGTISNNTSTAHYGGAGVLVSDATAVFHMYGGAITNNVIDYGDGKDEETLSLFYRGAGVFVNGGTMTVEGDVNISGNVRGNDDTSVVDNVELLRNDYYDGKIIITGELGDNAQIGVTAPKGEFTSGYFSSGNTKDPSEYFICDNGLSIGFDSLRQEAAVTDGEDDGGYDMVDAEVTGSTAATVGDTKIKFTVKVTLRKSGDASSTKTITDVVTVQLDSPLHGGNNTVTFEYKYNGVSGEQVNTKQLSRVVTPAKKHVNVTWACSGATTDGRNSAKRDYDGNDFFSSVTASYMGYDNIQKSVSGSWSSNAIIVEDGDGNSMTSAVDIGVYNFYLAPSVDYEFDNNLYTVTVLGREEDGYYQMQDATVIGVVGTPTVGDKDITVIVERKLKHTKDLPDITDSANYRVTRSTALQAGENTVEFDYKYTDARGGVQTKRLSVTVTAAKKNVTVTWYFDNSIAVGNTAKHVYDGVDARGKIVAVYDGIDGSKQRVDGTSTLMFKRDANGSFVNSLSEVGVYRLSLAASSDYVFDNNLFTYTVLEYVSDLTNLEYKESGETILGVSCDGGFENGTELAVERTDFDLNVFDGKINSAFNIKFLKDSDEVAPTGGVIVRVLIPAELRDGAKYKIYNLSNGIATEMEFTTEGNYAVFELDDLACILFVAEKDVPPIDDPIDDPSNDPSDGPISDSNLGDDGSGYYIARYPIGLIWLWIILSLLAIGIAVSITLFVVTSKRNKESAAASEYADPTQQNEPEQICTKVCPACGRHNDESAMFCGQCGNKLE